MKDKALISLIILLLSANSAFSQNKGSVSSYYKTNSNYFIENNGQIIDQNCKPNPAVLYLLNTPGMKIQLRKSGFSYDLYGIANIEILRSAVGKRAPKCDSSEVKYKFHRIDFDLVGSNPACEIIASGTSPNYWNCYTTGIPVEGVTNIRSFETVTYKNIYPCIDLKFLTDGEHGVKYNFVVNPGGKLSSIRMKIMGPEISITSSGSLKLTTTIGIVEEEIPHSFYRLNDVTTNMKCRFYQISKGIYGFSSDQKFPGNSTLLVDPVPQRLWATYYGGGDLDYAVSMSLDPNENILITGTTSSANNIATIGSFQSTYAGNNDAYFAKFNPAGQLLFGSYYGGAGNDGSKYCCISGDGSIYLIGSTTSYSNIATPGAFQQIKNDTTDAFIVKFSSSGQRIWGSYYGGSNVESGSFCCVSATSLYFCGTTKSPDNIATINSHQPIFGGVEDAFLVKFDTSGSRIWGTYYGGSSVEAGLSCRIVNDTILFLAGSTMSSSNISTPGSHQPLFSGMIDAFFVRFDTSGQRIWGTYYGGSQSEGNSRIGSDKYNRLYFSGGTGSLNNIATPGSFQPSLAGSTDGYLAKFNLDGQRIWATYYGGIQSDLIGDLVCDDSAFVFITGYTWSDAGISTPNAFQSDKSGFNDTYLAKFDSTGQRIWSTYYGAGGYDYGTAISIDGDIQYMLGYSTSLDSIATQNGWQYFFGGGGMDGFLVKFEDCTKPDGAQAITGPTDVCNNTTVQYNVPIINYSNSYIWNLPPGATISSGMNSNMIGVDFSSSAVSGIISVRGFNDCGPGDSSSIYVNVNPRPVPIITGPDSSCVQSIEVYSTQPGKSNYQWNKSSGGQVISGGTSNDNQIQVKWLIPGIQWIEVNFTDTNSCSALMDTHFPVTVIPGDSAKISISASVNNVCSGTLVTFTAVPTNPGTSPVYQWTVNGVNTGGNSSVYSYAPANGDLVQCILTSSLTVCISNNPATSNTISMVINPLLPVGVNVSASANNVCAGTSVTFTAAPVNGGSAPSYQWMVNGIPAGTNSPVYAYVPLNNDAVTCSLTSSETCTTGNPATSPSEIMIVNPQLPVSVSISASINPFCIGTPVSFTASPANGGPLAVYQWKVNGVNAGINAPVFTYNPVSGDVVTCLLTSSLQCISGNPAVSNAVSMTGNPGLPASVAIAANPNPFCPGSPVVFTAAPGNGGSTPAYQWKVNGVNAGNNSPSFTYNPADNDSVRCVMTSNLVCVSSNPASSNKIVMSGSLAPPISLNLCFDSVTTVGAKPFKLKGGLPLGGTWSGPGVNALTGTFDPAAAGTGLKTVVYSYTNVYLCNASKTKSITVQPNAVFSCGNSLTDIRDNKTYPTVQIGTQCWMAANLNRGSHITSSQVQFDNCVDEKYCFGNDAAKCSKYGGLYQWDEMMRYDDSPAGQGLCPPGWHIPTDNEWTVLFNFYNGNGFAGKPLQDTIISGFRALAGGVFYLNSSWSFADFAVLFWTSTPWGPSKALSHGLNIYNFSVSLYPSPRANAFPIRCLKD